MELDKISLEQFFFETPLYLLINGPETAVKDFIFYKNPIDGPCPLCQKNTTYVIYDKAVSRHEVRFHNGMYFSLGRKCIRDEKHDLFVVIKIIIERTEENDDNYGITKIGQFPSIATLNQGEIDKYRKVLGKHFNEFSKGVGLISHGVGIGAFVYLRRVFERLIEEAHKEAQSKSGWNEGAYQKSRMDDRISLLKDNLPEFLVENNNLYGVLSKGIHELSEQECLNIFPIVKDGIELILDEKIVKMKREEKIKNARQNLNAVHAKLKNDPKNK